MSVLGNAVMVGGKKPRILAVCVAQTNSTSMGSPASITWSNWDSQYFSAGSDYAHFVCKRAGSYTIRLCARSVYPTNSTTRTHCTARVYINSSYGTRVITSDAATYKTADYSVTLSVGDVVGLNAKASTGIYVPVNMMIVQQQ